MLIILDRDGVINQDSPNYIRSPADFQPIPGSLEAIAALNRAGHQVVVATNQSGIGRGYFSEETLSAIHTKMQDLLAAVGGQVDGIYYCPHATEDNCACRKPKPGLLYQIRKDFPDHFAEAVMVGDNVRDLQAAHAAGCRAVWIQGHERTAEHLPAAFRHVPSFPDLQHFVVVFLSDLTSQG